MAPAFCCSVNQKLSGLAYIFSRNGSISGRCPSRTNIIWDHKTAQPGRLTAATDAVRQAGFAETGHGAAPPANLSALIRSCLRVIEEEQLHELHAPVAKRMPAHVELSVTAEGIFTNHNQAASLPEDSTGLEWFLATYGASLLCYGYPNLQYADGSYQAAVPHAGQGR